MLNFVAAITLYAAYHYGGYHPPVTWHGHGAAAAFNSLQAIACQISVESPPLITWRSTLEEGYCCFCNLCSFQEDDLQAGIVYYTFCSSCGIDIVLHCCASIPLSVNQQCEMCMCCTLWLMIALP